MSNYDKILREKENRMLPGNTDKEKHWAAMEKQLLAAPRNSHQAPNGKLKILKLLTGLVAVLIIGLLVFKYFITKQRVIIETSITKKNCAVKPPMPKLNVPYEIFTYDASTGDTIFTQNGSILILPKDAVLDNNDKIVKGKIEIQTREFNDPLDYYMAGIPMTFDSGGIKYTFVSSGMIDIKAYQNGMLLKVNPNAKPQLNLASTNKEKNTNLYALDTLSGQWINKGRDEVNNVQTNLKKSFSSPRNEPFASTNIKPINDLAIAKKINTDPVVKPLQPQKASGKNPTIKITIDPNSFKELLAYDNLKFEVLNGTAETVGEDSKTEWDNVALLQKEGSINYIAKFSSVAKSVQYEVKPVLEGKDYAAAVSVYNEKIKAYYDLQKRRLANEQLVKDTMTLHEKTIEEENKKITANNELVLAQNKLAEIENKRIEELNILIIARNKKIEANKKLYLVQMKRQEAIIDSLQKIWETQRMLITEEIKRNNKRADSLRVIWEKENRVLALKENLLRSFTIDNFGYWNCDQPTFPKGILIIATFIDSQNNTLRPAYINAISFGTNRLLAYYNSNITVLPNTNHIIWSVYQNEFYYLTFKDYEKLNISYDTKNITIRLSKYNGTANSISDFRKILYGS